MAFGARLAVSSNVQRIGRISGGGEALGHGLHATAISGPAMHQHDTAFDRVAGCPVPQEGNLCAIARRKVTTFRQLGEIRALNGSLILGISAARLAHRARSPVQRPPPELQPYQGR